MKRPDLFHNWDTKEATCYAAQRGILQVVPVLEDGRLILK